MTVVGLDLSLTATGVAGATTDLLTIKPASRGVERLHWLRGQIVAICSGARLVVIEDVHMGAGRGRTGLDLAMLHGAVRVALYSNRVPFMTVAPQHVKIYAAGAGGADKAAVIASAVKRLGIEPADNNQADAAWLRAIGCALLGQPLAELPKTHTRALANLQLPLTPGDPHR